MNKNVDKLQQVKNRAEESLLNNSLVEVSDDGIPCFITNNGADAFRENLESISRQAVSVIVKHWSEDKYLILKWKKVDWYTFITGGIETGQTAEEAVRVEILEETGFKNLKLIKELGRVDAKFYHVPKKVNRIAHFQNFYFELENGECDEISDDEKSKHEILWVKRDEVRDILTNGGSIYTWNELLEM